MKKTVVITLVILAFVLIIALFAFLAFYQPRRAANPDFSSPSPVRGIRVDYTEMVSSRSEVAALESQMQAAGVNFVAVGAGRVDWTYFPWRGHPSNWSSEVHASGLDYLMQDSTRFGRWAHVSAAVDVLAPLYIQAHPQAAAISYTGQTSPNLVASMELVDGPFGQELLSMLDYIATYYPVNSITLTELVYYTDGFGPQDKAAYLVEAGRSDWPRNPDGTINIDDPSIGTWRSYEIGLFLDKAAAIVHKHGKQLYLEVRVGVDSTGKVIVSNGTDFNTYLNSVDRLVVWGNRDLDGNSESALSAVAHTINQLGPGKTILMIGIWDHQYDLSVPHEQMTSISFQALEAALQASGPGGATDLLITPSFLMRTQDWAVLQVYWSGR